MKLRGGNIYRFVCLFILAVFLTGITNLVNGDNLSAENLSLELNMNNSIILNQISPVSFRDLASEINGNEGKYKESSFRRAEIIFFISLPVSFLLTLGGTLLYKQISNNRGNFSSIEYSYIVLSSTGISLSIALRDYRLTKRMIER